MTKSQSFVEALSSEQHAEFKQWAARCFAADDIQLDEIEADLDNAEEGSEGFGTLSDASICELVLQVYRIIEFKREECTDSELLEHLRQAFS